MASSFSPKTLQAQIYQGSPSAGGEVLKEMDFSDTSSEGT